MWEFCLISHQVFCKLKTAINKSIRKKKKIKTDALIFISDDD